MTRFNLVFNGMILFNEIDNALVQVIIPKIDNHVRAFTSASKPARDRLIFLDTTTYVVSGLPAAPANAALRPLIPSMYYLLLKSGTVTINQAGAAAVSSIFQVPIPQIVRLFRASEPTANVFGSTTTSAAFDNPTVYHDIVVFSYTDIAPSTKISFKEQVATTPLATVTTPSNDVTINWVVYSTEGQAITDNRDKHVTAFNDFLLVNGQPTDFSLSAIGLKDVPYSSGAGLTPDHMKAVYELNLTASTLPAEEVSGVLGCSGGAIVRA